MSPEQFLQRIQKAPLAPVYLFLGPEVYQLAQCRRALVDKALGPEDRETGLSRHELEETTLANVLDDARSLSLFAPNRVLWVSGAETALPRGRAASDDENSAAAELAAYLKRPTPGTVLVFRIHPIRFRGRRPRQAGTRAEVLLRDSGRGRTAALHAGIGAAPGSGSGEAGRPADWLWLKSACWWNRWPPTPAVSQMRSKSCGFIPAARAKLPPTIFCAWFRTPGIHDFRVGGSAGSRRSRTRAR